MENLNTILYIMAGVLTLAEAVIRWGFPAFRKNPANAGTIETVDSLWVAMIIALSLKAVLVQPFTIPTGSMEDTLLVGDYLLVKKYEYGYSLFNKTPRFLQFKKPQKGDILVFVYPEDPSKDFIKRCRGVAGDVLEYKNKELYINGVKQDEPYVKHISSRIDSPADYNIVDRPRYGSRDNFGPVTVEAGQYFMMGDNRDNSLDSRFWGPVDEKLIKGKAWVIYWHSLNTANFIALFSLVTGAVCFLMLIPMWARKPNPADGELLLQEAESTKKFILYLMVGVFVLAGAVIFTVGLAEFREGLGFLGSRMFRLIH